MEKWEGVVDWKVEGYPGSTYLCLTFANNVMLYINDFGLKQFLVEPSGTEGVIIPT
jgi:hypothetical protein